MNIEDYLGVPTTMIKFNPKNSDHEEYLHQAREIYNYSIANCVVWFASLGIIINPAQC